MWNMDLSRCAILKCKMKYLLAAIANTTIEIVFFESETFNELLINRIKHPVRSLHHSSVCSRNFVRHPVLRCNPYCSLNTACFLAFKSRQVTSDQTVKENRQFKLLLSTFCRLHQANPKPKTYLPLQHQFERLLCCTSKSKEQAGIQLDSLV